MASISNPMRGINVFSVVLVGGRAGQGRAAPEGTLLYNSLTENRLSWVDV